MLADRGVEVDHTTLFRWVQAYASTLERRIRRQLRPRNGSWRVDETYIKVNGVWSCLYRAVDSLGQTIDFLLSAKRDAAAAQCFFRKALRQPHTVILGLSDQNRCAQSRIPSDRMVQGCSMSLFQAAQQWSTRLS